MDADSLHSALGPSVIKRIHPMWASVLRVETERVRCECLEAEELTSVALSKKLFSLTAAVPCGCRL